MFKQQPKIYLAGVDGHSKGCADGELEPSPLKAKLLDALGVEGNPWDEDVAMTSLGNLVADGAVQDLSSIFLIQNTI